MNLKLLLFFCVIFFTGCNTSVTSSADVLGKKKMQEVLWDIIRVEAYTKQFIKNDSTKNSAEENLKLQQRVFAIHHVTKEAFYSSYQYYQDHPLEMQPILDSIISAKQQAERDKYLQPIKKL
ncbi:DUF4296 domain-containing protein [Ferruginibacter lapsinanis]|uniref:DUF4296 domain-containing protein n=1 Tax=Ferruginibacter lapsinanis TaxID=563172 RepID=UPI001E334C63|nr:DUF4296 domain-containing protein [Ferruginibacter lapsinanis]UEG48588.1 DUF4296 domain-containing protein [Ferruginibacter lapsinanis]